MEQTIKGHLAFKTLTKDPDKLSPSTYFYIIDLGNGGKPFKGWVELIKN